MTTKRPKPKPVDRRPLFVADPFGVTARRLSRSDSCCARVSETDYTRGGYSWCEQKAYWKRGEQFLCDLHLGIILAGKRPYGITRCGDWHNSRCEKCEPVTTTPTTTPKETTP